MGRMNCKRMNDYYQRIFVAFPAPYPLPHERSKVIQLAAKVAELAAVPEMKK